MPKLEIAVLIGSESKEFLRDLTSVVERLEKLKTSPTPEASNGQALNGKKGKAVAAPVEVKEESCDEDEAFDLDEAHDEDEAKVTLKDVIAACKENRDKAIRCLKKLKVKSVHELKPDQYRKVLDFLGA
jgi:hypothetical protein